MKKKTTSRLPLPLWAQILLPLLVAVLCAGILLLGSIRPYEMAKTYLKVAFMDGGAFLHVCKKRLDFIHASVFFCNDILDVRNRDTGSTDIIPHIRVVMVFSYIIKLGSVCISLPVKIDLT